MRRIQELKVSKTARVFSKKYRGLLRRIAEGLGTSESEVLRQAARALDCRIIDEVFQTGFIELFVL